MIRFYKIPLIFLYIIFFYNVNCAQNEFYNNGGIVYLNGSIPTTPATPSLFINGNITNNDGSFTNDGSFLEIKGDFTNNPIMYAYESKNGAVERFSGNTEQAIKGIWNGTYEGYNQFCNLKVFKSGHLSGNNKYLTLNTDVNVSADGSIEFERDPDLSNEAIIRTDNAATSPVDPDSYQFTLYLRNPSTSAISGYAHLTTNGSAPVTSLYIEGKLKRQVNTIDGTYEFPVGLRPDLKDGMEPFSLTFNRLDYFMGIVGFVRNATVNTLYRNVLCDIGTDPGPGQQQFPDCTGGRDGIYDLYYLDNDVSHEWSVTPDNVSEFNDVHAYDYNISLYPGPILDNLNYYTIPAACAADYSGQRLRVVAKDGIVGGTTQTGPGNYAPFAHLNAYLWCEFDDQTLPISLNNQTTFSSYRIHGTSDFTGTVLPVELVKFQLEPVNNEYFNLTWQTASELNNAGFFVERSENNNEFQSLGWISGNGTTSTLHNYNFEDHEINKNKTYYYRLKQVDLDQSFKNSYVISGKIEDKSSIFNVMNITPNPATDNAQVSIIAPNDGIVQIVIYDVFGQIMKKNSVGLIQGTNNVHLDVTNLPSMAYMVAFNYDNKTMTKKIIKK